MPNIQGAPLEEQVKKLLEQNLAYSREIYVMSKKIKSYMLWGRIMTLGSLLFFVVIPLILSIAYLPSLIKSGLGNIINPAAALDSLNPGSGAAVQLLNNSNTNTSASSAIDAYKKILEQYKNQ